METTFEGNRLRARVMPRATNERYGFVERPLTVEEVDVLGDALDEYQQAARYAAGLSNGEDREMKFRRAQVATTLLKRVAYEEERTP